MKYVSNSKRYYLVTVLLLIIITLAACSSTKNKEVIVEKRVAYDNYLFVVGFDSMGNIITADEDSFIIFDDSLNVLKDIAHNITEPFNCYAVGDVLYISTMSKSVIYRYSLQENQLTLLDEISTGLSNALILKVRESNDGLYYLASIQDSRELSIYRYEYESGNTTKLDVTGVEWFDNMNDNKLLISTSNKNHGITLSSYDVINKTIGDSYDFNDDIQDFTYAGDMCVFNIYGGNQLVSIDLKAATKKTVYQGAANASLSGFIHQKDDYYYFCDTGNQLLIKLPVDGIYQSTYIPSANDNVANDDIKEVSELDDHSDEHFQSQDSTTTTNILGQLSINQNAINEVLDKIEPISEDKFELVILTDMQTLSNKSAEAMFKRKYPNAVIRYEIIQDTGMVKENSNPYEREYDRQLKLKLLANESDFDLFYITSPETLTQVVHSGGYLDLTSPQIEQCMNQMFGGVVYNCSYEDTIFGMPISTSFYGMQVNDELVRTYGIEYPFKKEPLKYNELITFAEKYCKDYDSDGEIDVFLTTAHEGTLENGTKVLSNSLLLSRRYDSTYIDFLRNEGIYQSAILNKIDEVNKQLEPYCLITANSKNNNYLFSGPEGTYQVNPIDNNSATYLPVFEDREVYQATFHYLCGNKFSDKKEYILDYLACVGDVININGQNLIYKDPTVYETYFNNIQIDQEHFAFYQRIVDHSVTNAILSWDSYTELRTAMGKDWSLYMEGQITSDTLYDRYNQKLDMILNE